MQDDMRMMNGEVRGAAISLPLGFLLGALVGAGVALMFAPATGAETRRRVGRTAREGFGRARDTLNSLRHDARDAVDAGRDAMQAGRESLRDTLRDPTAP